MGIDKSLQESAKALVAAAAQGRALRPLLKKLCPQIQRQIVSDGKTPGLLSFWGRSMNFDENAKKAIVAPAILEAIGALAGEPMRGKVVHAGLQHTYGYLFSLIDTPFGTKRERWVSEDWERCFGMDTSLLGPLPSAGTLLANLTWFLGQIVYRGDAYLERLKRIEPAVAPELVRFDYSRIDVCRIAEDIVYLRRKIRIVTDLVQPLFAPSNPETMSALLIYSIQNGAKAPLRLVTAFPIREPVERELRMAAMAGKVPVKLHFNAYLPGLTGKSLSGRRSLVSTTESPAEKGTQKRRSPPGSGSRA